MPCNRSRSSRPDERFALVYPEDITDLDVRDLSDDIAAALRKELTFPGQVRICDPRESSYKICDLIQRLFSGPLE